MPAWERVEGARVMRWLAMLPTRRAAEGNADDQVGLRATEELIERELRAIGYVPVRWPFTHDPAAQRLAPAKANSPTALRWHNIIAEIPGSTLAHEVVILGAHFDAVPGSPGADDDGTGTAALLELARVLKDQAPARTIRLAFFNGEEVGLVGSRSYAQAAHRAQRQGTKKVHAMLSLEMLGFYCDEQGCQVSPVPSIPGVFTAPTVGDFLGVATTKSHAWIGRTIEKSFARVGTPAHPAVKILAPDFIPDLPLTPPDFLRSDHAPFLLLGMPAAMIGDTANYRSPHYHKPSDTIATIDAARFESAVRGVAATALALANAPDFDAAPR